MTRLFHAYPFLARFTTYFLVFLTMVFMSGCTLVKVVHHPGDAFSNTLKPDRKGRAPTYLVLVTSDEAWHLANHQVQGQFLTGTLEPLRDVSRKYTNILFTKASPLHFPKKERIVTEDLYLFLNESKNLEYGKYEGDVVSVPLSAIDSIKQIKQDRTGPNILIGIGIGIGLPLVIGTVALILFPPSVMYCPFVYASDGRLYHFEGELFPGALTPELARDDYLRLPHLQPDEGSYQLIIADELMEEEYIDLATLRIIQHPEGTQVLIDQDGNPQVFGTLQPFTRATTADGTGIAPLLGQKDGNSFCFDQPQNDRSSVVLTFDKPANAKQLKLWLTAVNTRRMGQALEEFASNYAPKNAATAREGMQSRGFPIALYLQTSTGWQQCGYLQPTGPLAWRDLAAHIDLRKHEGNSVTIKLETGANFWELDYVAADFSANPPISDMELLPRSAWTNDNQDYTVSLSHADEDYLVLPGPGNHVRIEYEVPDLAPGTDQSIFLHGKGYYQPLPDYHGVPAVGQVKAIESNEL